MRGFFSLAAVLLVLSSLVSGDDAKPAPKAGDVAAVAAPVEFAKPATGAAAVPTPAATKPALDAAPCYTATCAKDVLEKSLSWRQRRQLGLTIGNVREAMKALKDKGELSPDTNVAATQVMAHLIDANPTAWKEVGKDPAVDWDAILEFIARLIELILKLFPLFV